MIMDDKLIIKRFNAWTKGHSAEEARISVFEHIRDIPYAIVPELRDPDTGPVGLIKLNKGSCVPKHFLMAFMLGELGLSVKYANYLFSWDDPAIKYPESIKKILPAMPVTAHLACKAYINNRWALVDATYDLPLKKAGFMVTERWDGRSDTKNAVRPLEEIVHEVPESMVRYTTERRSGYTEKEKAAYAQFTKELNSWLEEIRKR